MYLIRGRLIILVYPKWWYNTSSLYVSKRVDYTVCTKVCQLCGSGTDWSTGDIPVLRCHTQWVRAVPNRPTTHQGQWIWLPACVTRVTYVYLPWCLQVFLRKQEDGVLPGLLCIRWFRSPLSDTYKILMPPPQVLISPTLICIFCKI